MEFSEVLLNFRARYGLTQMQMARLLEVSPNMVYFYENGKYAPTARNKIRFETKMKDYEEEKNVL